MGVTWSVEHLSDRARRVVVCGTVDIAAEQPGSRFTAGPASESVTRVLEIAGVLDWSGDGNGTEPQDGAAEDPE